jgi:hypothetical protein
MKFMDFTAGNINSTLFLDVTLCRVVVTDETTRRHVAEESISYVKILNHKCLQPVRDYRYFFLQNYMFSLILS